MRGTLFTRCPYMDQEIAYRAESFRSLVVIAPDSAWEVKGS